MNALLVAALCLATPDVPAPAEFEAAQAAAAANQLQKAISLYKAALDAQPTFAPAANGLGLALFRSGRRVEAVEQFRNSISADASFAVAYLNLGFASRAMGDLDTALAAYQRYAQIAPWDADGFRGLSETYRLTGDAQGAEVALAQCRAIEAKAAADSQRDRTLFALQTPPARTVVAAGRP
jgi:tetratricopeptide (TPR) repeat protein